MNYRFWVLGAVFFGLVGCAHQQTRLQSDDDTDREKEPEVRTIGDVTGVANAEPIPVSGVGLVVGLEGTGGSPPPGGFRSLLEEQMRKRGRDPKEILASPNASMVLVSAQIPAGAHKDDPLDIEITLPPQSKTTSLRGGYLQECLLYNYDNTKHLDPEYTGQDRLLKGHAVAKAEGPLLVGFGDGDEAGRVRQGRIWGGGRSKIDRPFYLVLNTDQQRAPVAQKVAERINETFQGPYHGAMSDLAAAKNNQVIFLRVAQQYQHNLPRYLRVVRLIPLREAPGNQGHYHHRLEEELLDPAHTVTAALRLEALGNGSVETLKHGLSSTHPLVRFTSAEALAYLGSPSCGEELAHLVEQQPALRAFSLTALASLDEAICHVKLRELLSSPSAETRYGAFRALRALDERDPALQGELLNDSFWLHRMTPNSPPLVHLSCSRRAEVVLFGEDPYLVPPFSLLAGEFTITASRDDARCTISRMSISHGSSRRQCSLKLEEVVRTMADLGGVYPDVVDLLRQAGSYECVTCRVAIDALPQATSVYELAKSGNDPEFLKTDEEILNARADFGSVPTLFDKGTARHTHSTLEKDKDEDEEALHKSKVDKKKEERKAKVGD